MRNISRVLAVAAMTTLSMTVSAWWDGPWGDHAYGDAFGDGYIDGGRHFDMGAGARGHGRGYGYDDYGYPYRGYPFGFVPMVPSAGQQKAFEEQRKAFEARHRDLVSQQSKAFLEAIEAQRKYAQKYATQPRPVPAPFFSEQVPLEPASTDRSSGPEQLETQMELRRQRLGSMRPNRDDVLMDSRRVALRSQLEARREALRSQVPGIAADSARREERRKQMELRHAEILERIEAQRKRAAEQHAIMRGRPFEVRRSEPET